MRGALVLLLVLVAVTAWTVLWADPGEFSKPEDADCIAQRVALPSSDDSIPGLVGAQRQPEPLSATGAVLEALGAQETALFEGRIVDSFERQMTDCAGEILTAITGSGSRSEQAVAVSSGRFQVRARTGDRVTPLSLLLDGGVAVALDEFVVVKSGQVLQLRCCPAQSVELIVIDKDNGQLLTDLTVLRSERQDAVAPASSALPSGASVLVERGPSPLKLEPQTASPPRAAIERLFVRAPGTAWASVDVDWRAGGCRRIELAPVASLEVEILGGIPGPSLLERASRCEESAGVFVRIREQDGLWGERASASAPQSTGDSVSDFGSVQGEKHESQEVQASLSEAQRKVQEARDLGLLGGVRNELALPASGIAMFHAMEPGHYFVTIELGSRETPLQILGLEPVDLKAGVALRVSVAAAAPIGPRCVPLAGTVSMAMSWPLAEFSLLFTRCGDETSAVLEEFQVRGTDLEPDGEHAGTFRFDVGEVPAGQYAVAECGSLYHTLVETGPLGSKEIEIAIPNPVQLKLQIVDRWSGDPITIIPPRMSRIQGAGRSEPVWTGLRWDEPSSVWTAWVVPGIVEITLEEDALESWSGELVRCFDVDARHKEFTLKFDPVVVASVGLEINGERTEWPEDCSWSLRIHDSGGSDLGPIGARSGVARFKLPHAGRWTVVAPQLEGCRPIEPISFVAKGTEIQQWTIQASSK